MVHRLPRSTIPQALLLIHLISHWYESLVDVEWDNHLRSPQVHSAVYFHWQDLDVRLLYRIPGFLLTSLDKSHQKPCKLIEYRRTHLYTGVVWLLV
jgi:hypothetical protein